MDEDEDAAALRLQGMWRRRKARIAFKQLLLSLTERVYDPQSGSYYYFNTRTGASSWTAPSALDENEVLSPRSRVTLEIKEKKRAEGRLKTADMMTEDEAARTLQGLWRTRKSRMYLRMLLRSCMEKVFDPNTGASYYYNKRTGESSWSKPALLGSEDIDEDGDVAEVDIAEEVQQVMEQKHGAEAAVTEVKEDDMPQLEAWLDALGLGNLTPKLVDEGFDDFEALLAIRTVDMDDLGMEAADIAKLNDQLHHFKLKKGMNVSPDDADGVFDDDNEEGDDGDDALDDLDSVNDEEESEFEDGNRSEQDSHEEGSEAGDSGDDVDGSSDEDMDTPILGVEIETLFPGDGENFPRKGEYARVHYSASLEDGTVFESSRKRGRAFEFRVGAGHVIIGWDKAIRRMSRGQRTKLTIQPEMGYGAAGRVPVVPPNSTLLFEVELIDMYEAEVGVLPDDDEDYSSGSDDGDGDFDERFA